MRQGASGPGPRPDTNDDEQMDQDDDHLEGKGGKSNELDLGALERDLLQYQLGKLMEVYSDDTIVFHVPYEGSASQFIRSGSDRHGNGIMEE